MNEVKDATRNLLDALKTERDELKVQVHLASAEVRDRLVAEMDDIEHKWAELKSQLKQAGKDFEQISSTVGDDLEDITDNAGENAKAIVKEIREGYERIRDRLKS